MKQWIAALTFVTLFTACSKENEGSKEPKITFLGVDKREVKQGASDDAVRITFKVDDANADLHNDGETESIFIKDSRYPATGYKSFVAPDIPPALMDPAYGFSGSYFVDMKAAFLIFKDTLNNRQRDTVDYEIYIKDMAGNESNHITTGEIYIVK